MNYARRIAGLSLALLALPLLAACPLTPDQRVKQALDFAFLEVRNVTVDLSGIPLSAVPQDLFERDCGKVTKVVMNGCGLTSLPIDFFARFPELRELSLVDNAIEELPDGIDLCPRLHTLYLEGNRLRSLPDDLGKLRELRLLLLANNSLSSIVDLSPLAPTLESLDLSGNPLGTTLGSLPEFDALLNLNLARTGLASFDARIVARSPLLELDLSGNGLAEAPDLPFAGLRFLRLADNSLASFPDTSKCGSLVELDLSRNPLADVDASRLPESLETLIVTGSPASSKIAERLSTLRPELKVVTE
jgi:Leucine-rich repeat (LRR) protein